jgi:hypothetical protein
MTEYHLAALLLLLVLVVLGVLAIRSAFRREDPVDGLDTSNPKPPYDRTNPEP